MKMVDYMVDGGDGEEEFCNTKQEAIKIAQQLANEKNEAILIYRWARPDRYSDFEIDEGFELCIKPMKGELK